MSVDAHSTLLDVEDTHKQSNLKMDMPGYHNHKGGGQAYTLREDDFLDYMVEDFADRLDPDSEAIYSFHSQSDSASAGRMCEAHSNLIPTLMPMEKLIQYLTHGQIISVAKLHDIRFIARGIHVDALRESLRGHDCEKCEDMVTLLKPARRAAVRQKDTGKVKKKRITRRKKSATTNRVTGWEEDTEKKWMEGKITNNKRRPVFPPVPPSDAEKMDIIANFCRAQSPYEFEEVGCAVCGQLVKRKHSLQLDDADLDTTLLYGLPGSTRKERTRASQPIEELSGAILAKDCTHVCKDCNEFLENRRLPINTLANGLWIGDVPEALKNLTYAERILIARARQNRCVVKVQSGMWKMHANAVTFSNPILSVYNTLPPTIADVDEVLAFIYIGHVQPSDDDLKKTPMVVRRSRVAAALEWLKLNNEHYADLNISYTNLAAYPENGCPFVYDFYKRADVRDIDALPANDDGEEQGTEKGSCSFVVHGLMESDLILDSGKLWKELKAVAMQHLADGGHVLAVRHSNTPLSTIDNPSLYPQMFPCLFPYGKGGLDQPSHHKIISNAVRKKWLLQYHDKRFQTDSFFPLIALNQEQIKQSSAGGKVMANKKDFEDIADRLLSLDLGVLESMIKKMADGERIQNPSAEETQCFRIMHDIDLVGQHVQGSITTK
ncbi:hypothetical protein HWV62_14284 [Athelia sp. TMB]|nr:hypothetical protein HWV62_14284 [Athelia sp. TMB]